MPSKKLMTADEVVEIARVFTQLGVTKIRLTGGEPLVRPDFDTIIHKLSTLPTSIHLSTNATLLHHHIDSLVSAGLRDINISIDSLDELRFLTMTKVDTGKLVKENIILALKRGLKVKLNTVLIRGMNDNEIIDLVSLSKEFPLSVRFIEFMPFDGNNWEYKKGISHDEILALVEAHFQEKPTLLPVHANDTSKNYKLSGFKGNFGVISTVSKPFCENCNRIRLTADGKLKNCLFASHEVDLLTPFRAGKDITPIIIETILQKEKVRGGMENNDLFNIDAGSHKNRSMIAIGG